MKGQKSSFSKEVWNDNYRNHNEKSVKDTWKRIATSLAKVEKNDVDYWTKEFYNVLINFKFVPAGRIIANVGGENDNPKSNTTLMNCFTYTPTYKDVDSIEGIYKMLGKWAKVLSTEGGVGGNFSHIRPEGTFIEGARVRTPGVLKFLELFDKSSEIITKGTTKKTSNTKKNEKRKSRKGAQICVLDCFHPDIMDFIKLKQKSNVLTKFNLSVGISSDFIDAVKNDKSWKLRFPDTNFDKYNDEWNGDIEEWEDKNYPVVIYETIKARDLWDVLMESTYSRNEPGVLFTGNINKYNQLSYVEKIRQTNPCVVGDTLLFTNIGWIKIKNLDKYNKKINDELRIITSDKSLNLYESILDDVGITEEDAEIYKVSLNNGEYILTNDKHNLYDNEFNEINIKDTKNKVVYGNPFNKKIKVIDVEKTEIVEDVYDITATPNYNFFSIVNRAEDIDIDKIYVNDNVSYYRYSLVNTSKGKKFAHQLEVDNYFSKSILNVDCGEQPLPAIGNCLLGSMNLTQYVKDNFLDYYFDFDEFSKDVKLAVRMLDNINEITKVPFNSYKEEIKRKRRIGLGIMGLGSMLYMMGLSYGSEEGRQLFKNIMKVKAESEFLSSAKLGKEKGSFEVFDREKHFDNPFWNRLNISEDIRKEIEDIGEMRNGIISTIAPNGNTAILAGVVSGGVEPVYMKNYSRWTIVSNAEKNELEGKGYKLPDKDDLQSDSIFKTKIVGNEKILEGEIDGTIYRVDGNRGLTKSVDIEDYGYSWVKLEYSEEEIEAMEKNNIFSSVESLTVSEHLKMLQVATDQIGSAVSKTVNIPENYPYNDFKDLYLRAYDMGIKGITTYRSGTMTAVLENKDKVKEYQNELEKMFDKANGNIIPTDIKIPQEYYSKGYTRKDINGTKWYFNVAFADKYYKKPFAIFVQTNSYERTSVAEKVIKDVEKLCRDKGISNKIIDYQQKKYAGQSNVNKIARVLGLALRHNIPILDVVNVLEDNPDGFSTLLFHTKKILSTFIKNGTKVEGKFCPNCNSTLTYESGCVICPQCGFSQC